MDQSGKKACITSDRPSCLHSPDHARRAFLLCNSSYVRSAKSSHRLILEDRTVSLLTHLRTQYTVSDTHLQPFNNSSIRPQPVLPRRQHRRLPPSRRRVPHHQLHLHTLPPPCRQPASESSPSESSSRQPIPTQFLPPPGLLLL